MSQIHKMAIPFLLNSEPDGSNVTLQPKGRKVERYQAVYCPCGFKKMVKESKVKSFNMKMMCPHCRPCVNLCGLRPVFGYDKCKPCGGGCCLVCGEERLCHVCRMQPIGPTRVNCKSTECYNYAHIRLIPSFMQCHLFQFGERFNTFKDYPYPRTRDNRCFRCIPDIAVDMGDRILLFMINRGQHNAPNWGKVDLVRRKEISSRLDKPVVFLRIDLGEIGRSIVKESAIDDALRSFVKTTVGKVLERISKVSLGELNWFQEKMNGLVVFLSYAPSQSFEIPNDLSSVWSFEI